MRVFAPLSVVVALLAFASTAAARRPVIAYLNAASRVALYDSETGAPVAAPSITVPNSRYFAVSANGRFVFYRDAQKKLHLYDRQNDAEKSLPGINVFANPDRPSVSNAGLLAFDGGDSQVRVYDSSSGSFVMTGFAADSGHRQSALSADGKLLATTCLSGSGKCIGESPADTDSDSNVFVQSLATRLDTGLPDLSATDKDLEHPCVNGDGSLVGADVDNKDLVLYDRKAHADITPAGLKTNTAIEVHCVLSSGGRYVGLDDNAGNFKLYDRTAAAFITLPAAVTAPAWLTSPYQKPASPPGGGTIPPPPPLVDTVAPIVSRLSAKPRRFRPRAAGGHGTLLRLTLSEPATVRVRLMRRSHVIARYRLRGVAGVNKRRLSGRVRRRGHSLPLAPGSYVLRIVATDAAGNRSLPVAVKLTVLRRAR